MSPLRRFDGRQRRYADERVRMAAEGRTHQAPALGRTPRGVLVALCITEITSWGVLYYAYPVLAPTIAADTGWSASATAAAFSAALVVAGLAGIPLGRYLDRHGPRWIMTCGSILAALAVAGVAAAPNVSARQPTPRVRVEMP